jgi:hypothetical protein
MYRAEKQKQVVHLLQHLQKLSMALAYRFLPKTTHVIGYGRSKKSDEELRQKAGSKLSGSEEDKKAFLKTVSAFGRRLRSYLSGVWSHSPFKGCTRSHLHGMRNPRHASHAQLNKLKQVRDLRASRGRTSR